LGAMDGIYGVFIVFIIATIHHVPPQIYSLELFLFVSAFILGLINFFGKYYFPSIFKSQWAFLLKGPLFLLILNYAKHFKMIFITKYVFLAKPHDRVGSMLIISVKKLAAGHNSSIEDFVEFVKGTIIIAFIHHFYPSPLAFSCLMTNGECDIVLFASTNIGPI
ncbi:hypothetical protein ACJX0J_008893, partial [Zea mays]